MLLCDPSKKNLRDALHALLVDQTNRLVLPKREKTRRDEGMLCDWYRDVRSGEALSRPLDEIFPAEVEKTVASTASATSNAAP